VNGELETILRAGFSNARAIEPSDADIARVLARAQRRRGRWRWRLGRGPTILLAGAALVLGAGAAAELISRDTEIDEHVRNQGPFKSSGEAALDRLIARARTKAKFAPLADTFSIEARQDSPDGGLDWALIVWRSETGGWCHAAARQGGDKVGVVREDGRFVEFPFHEGNACTPGPLAPDEASFTTNTYAGGPTLVHGVAGRAVASIEVDGLPGVTKLAVTDRGAFLAVIPQEIRDPTLRLVLVLRDGTRRAVGRP
jgi:hypothetical protein